mgnify:CR=1 FL=1
MNVAGVLARGERSEEEMERLAKFAFGEDDALAILAVKALGAYGNTARATLIKIAEESKKPDIRVLALQTIRETAGR